jgi:O-antigen/teichoic acid export membrane protein
MKISPTTGSVNRKLLSGSVLGVVQLVAAAVVSFFLMSFLVHRLGDRVYGFWSLAVAFIGYYGLLDLGMSSAVSQYICIAIGRKDPVECRAVFNAALRIQSLFGGIALLATVIAAFATPWFCRDPADAHLFARVIAILGVTAAVGFPTRVYVGLLEAELRFDIQSWLGIAGLALRTGLIIWAIQAGGGLLALAWMTLFATLPITALQIWFARREAPWAKIEGSSIESERLKSLSSYSIYTFVSMIANALRFQIDPIVISAFIGLAAVTHYRVASVFMAYYVNLIISSTSMFQPLLSRLYGAGDRSGLEKVFFFATKVSLSISVFIGFSLIFWGKPFVSRWMGARYDDAYWPMVVLSLAVFLDVGQSPSINLLYATFKHRSYTYVNLAEGVINLLFSLALVRPLGILGVALGTLIAAVLIRVMVQPFVVCAAAGLHYGGYMRFLGGNLLRCSCLVSAAIAISAWGLRPSYPYLISSAICATALYAVGSWFIVFNAGEREHLLAALTNRTQAQPEPAVAGALVS